MLGGGSTNPILRIYPRFYEIGSRYSALEYIDFSLKSIQEKTCCKSAILDLDPMSSERLDPVGIRRIATHLSQEGFESGFIPMTGSGALYLERRDI